MASFDQHESENSFEIEFSQLSDARRHLVIPFWRARGLDATATSGERRRRYSRMATLVAIVALVLINSLSLAGLSQFFPASLPLVSTSLSNNSLTAHASGFSWFKLRQRPLHLPALSKGEACPVTPLTHTVIQLRPVTGIGNGTVFATTQNMDADGVQRPVRSDFFHLASTYRGELVTWYVRLPDVEPVLIRGAQLDGPHTLLFDGGIEQPNFDRNFMGGRTLPQLLISSNPSHGSPVASWTTVTRVASSGCYAYQIDTPSKTVVLVFRAIVEP
ncbi:MAG TPA: hypothetical protein VFU63_13890 [Ktedonobacterales bacterium]|nr:hypothetical protein [Ktedonobacterales bacterium]